MTCKVGASTEDLATLITCVRLLSRVNRLVGGQAGAHTKGLATLLTLVRFLSSVSPPVTCQV